MEPMSKLHLTDGGWVDPYSKEVSDLLIFIEERFPGDESWHPLRDEILTLDGTFKGLFHGSLELVQVRLYELQSVIANSQVPRRDISLAKSRFERIERLSRLFTGISASVQGSLEEAYLDATQDERPRMMTLADLRDTVFETEARRSAVRDYLEELERLVEQRKARGWPAWKNLEDYCVTLRTFTEGPVRV